MKKITLLILFLSTLWGYSQVRNYKFSQATGVYTEITGGTLLGNESSDAQYFVDAAVPLGGLTRTGLGLPIGFNFTFNDYVYNRFAVSADGWISLGASALSPAVDCTVTNSKDPLSSTAATTTNLSAKIAALGMDLMAQTGSSIRYQTIGASPNRVLVVQWKGFKKGGSIGDGDNFNFQIRLEETTNKVSVAYGTFVSNLGTPVPTAQVGLRADPATIASNLVNRLSTTDWANTTLGTAAASGVTINGTIVPSTGLVYTWVSPVCQPTNVSIYEDFDNYSGIFFTKALPDCWSKIVSGSADAYITNSSPPAAYSAPNRLNMSGGTAATPIYVVMPTLSNLQVGVTPTHRLRFKAYASVANTTLDVGYMTDRNNEATFVLIEGITLTSIATSAQFVVSPKDIPANATNLVFKNRGNNTTGASLTIYIDDVVWEPVPACTDISSLEGKGFTHNSVNLSWKKGGSETNWEYAYGSVSALNPNEQTISDVTATVNGTTVTTTISGLSSATSYKIWVRAKCTNGAWMGPVVFSTTPVPVTQFMENFDAVPVGTTLPLGWSKVGTTGGVTIGSGGNFPLPTAPNFLQLTGASTAAFSMVALPPVTNLAAGTHRLRFKIRGFVSNSSVDVGYLTDIADAKSWTTLTSVVAPLTYAYVEVGPIGLAALTTTSVNLAIRNPGNIIGGHVYIDNVSWEADSTISCPDVSNFKTISLSSNSVGLTWNAGGGTGELWEYAIGSAALQNPFTLTPKGITSTVTPLSVIINELTPGTSYRVWIRSKCTSGPGAWIGPIEFTTPCVSGDGFTQDFNASAAIPACWYKASGTVSISSSTLALYGGKTLGIVPGICALPPVSNIGVGNYRIKFKYRFSAPTNNAPVELGYMTNASDPDTFSPIKALTGTHTTFSQDPIIVELGEFSGSETLAFRYSGTSAGITIGFVDDVTVEQIPLCDDISNLKSVEVTSSTVSLDWDNADGQEAWQYAVGNSLVTSPTGLSATDVLVVSEVTVDDLAPNTNYKVWVRPKCGENGVGSWSAPIEFKTTCTPVNGISQTFNDIDNGQLPVCWTRVGTGGTYNLQNYTVAGSKAIAMGPTQIGGNYIIDNPIIVAMPPISNPDAEDYVLKFMYAAAMDNAAIEVGYVTNILEPNSFTLIENGRIEIDEKEVLQKAVVRVNNPLANILAFRNGSTTPIFVYLDDVSWEPAPTAAPECATNVTAVTNANCGNFATEISWSSVADADGYYLTIGTTQGGDDVLNQAVYKLNYSFLGLAGQKYFYTVKPFNIIGTAGECGTKDFTTSVNGCYCVSVPSSKTGKGISNVLLGGTNFVPANETYSNYTTKPVNLNKAEKANLKLTFDTRQLDGNGPFYYTKVWVDFNNDFNFDSTELVYKETSGITNDGPVVLDASFDIPTDAALRLHTVRIVAGHLSEEDVNPCYNGSNAVTLDLKVNLMSATALAANDVPSAAVALTVGQTFTEYSVTGSNVNATGSLVETMPGCGGYNGADVWYKAVVPASGKITFEINSVTNGLTNTAAAVYSGIPDALTLVDCNDSSSTMGDDHPRINLVRTAGETLYFRVWENGGDAYGDFSVSAYESATLGTDSFDTVNFRYYPNPVKDILNISFDQEISEVVVMNLLGQKIITSRSIGTVNANQAKINMSELSKGTYLVKVIAGNQSRTIKAVKE